MAKLNNCNTCGGTVSSDARNCPHCGAKQPRSSKGCLLVIILIIVIAIAANSGTKSEENIANQPVTENKSESPKQTKPFDETTARSFTKMKLEEVLKVRTKIRYEKIATVNKLKGTFNKTMGFKGDLYEVKGEFEILNEYNVWIKSDYRAVVEFLSGKGYRVCLLQINGIKVFPAAE